MMWAGNDDFRCPLFLECFKVGGPHPVSWPRGRSLRHIDCRKFTAMNPGKNRIEFHFQE